METEKFYKFRKQLVPVLRTKVHELKKIGITNVSKQDIWNNMVYAKWKNEKEIGLSEKANDILSLKEEQNET